MKTTTKAAPSADGFASTRPIGAATKGAKLPDFGPRCRPFLLAAHASSWELCETSEGWRLVPVLKRLILQAGVNGTKQAKKGEVLQSAQLEARARTRWDMTPIIDLDEYLVEIDGKTGPGIFTRWERVKTYPDGNWSIAHDDDGYRLWRWGLVTSGRLEGPRDEVIDAMRRRLTRQKDRASRTPHLAAAQRAEAEADTRTDGLAQALEALRQPAKKAG